MAAEHQQLAPPAPQNMSTSTKTKVPAPKKPKRPLSGYNLFYRYKRNKVVEATARPDGDNEANIRAILVAPPGLEGVPPDSPVLGLPPARLNEFRAAAIRQAMEGKLFPNENGRDRQHVKVHGMGFVEMGRMVRRTWGRADKLAKDVFNDLADVGRVRYRRLVAEHKLRCEREERKASQEGPLAVEAPSSSSDPMLEALSAWAATRNHNLPASAVPVAVTSSREEAPPARRLSSTAAELDLCDASLFEPLPSHPAKATELDLYNDSLFDIAMTTFNPAASADDAARADGPRQGRRVSAAEVDFRDDSLFDAAMAAFRPASGDGPRRGRRVSARAAEVDGDDAPLDAASPASGVPPSKDAEKGNGPRRGRRVSAKAAELRLADTDLEAIQTTLEEQVSLRLQMQRMREQIIKNDSLLPSDMRVFSKDDVVPQEQAVGPPSDKEAAENNGDNGDDAGILEEREASARDFAELFDVLDEAIDVDPGVMDVGSGDLDGGAHVVFGKPVHRPSFDWGDDGPGLRLGDDKPGSRSPFAIPMPADVELRTDRARMA